MYATLLFLHNITRWLVLAGLLLSLFRAYKGYTEHRFFSKTDNRIRHYTATIAHIQLVFGIILYIKSPLIQYFWKQNTQAMQQKETVFFALAHSLLMLSGIIAVTIGSALAKRKTTDMDKYSTLLWWYGTALFIIIIAIPWPFSPFAMRPLSR